MHYKRYKKVLSPKNGLNIYRGCDHGCIYCDSRSACYNMDHEFTDIEVKEDAWKMLDIELSLKRKPVMIGTGSMSDPYNHLERNLEYTRKCLEVVLKHECGISILTKSDLILRDIDLIDKINRKSKAVVEMTLTTMDDDLCRIVEPNVSVTSKRIEVLMKCKSLGIPTIVWLCPFLPFINDNEENIRGLLDACKKASVKGLVVFGIGLTLREGNREYFYRKLDEFFPGLKERYIETYGERYEISSPNSKRLYGMIREFAKENNMMIDANEIFDYMREMPENKSQLSIFDFYD